MTGIKFGLDNPTMCKSILLHIQVQHFGGLHALCATWLARFDKTCVLHSETVSHLDSNCYDLMQRFMMVYDSAGSFGPTSRGTFISFGRSLIPVFLTFPQVARPVRWLPLNTWVAKGTSGQCDTAWQLRISRTTNKLNVWRWHDFFANRNYETLCFPKGE